MAAALGVTLSVSASAGVAQAAGGGGWQRGYRSTSGTSNQLYSVAAISGSNAWAVGSWGRGALVMHWNGSRWSRVTVAGQASFYLTQVAASSAGNVWAFGNTNNGLAGVALRWDGSLWQRVPLPAGAFPDAAAVLSGSDVWISGQQSCTGSGSAASCQTGMYRWNGSSWAGPYLVPALVNTISAAGAGHIWLVGEAGTSQLPGPYRLVAYQWSGQGWTSVRVPAPRSSGPPDLQVVSRSDVWLYSWLAAKPQRGYLLHWNGTGWRQIDAPAAIATSDGLITDGQGGVWAGPWAHWTGRRWLGTVPGPSFAGNLNSFDLRGLARIPGRTTVWGVGEVSHSPTSPIWDTLIARYP